MEGPRPAHDDRGRAPQGAGRRDRHDLPGPADGPQPGAHGGPPDRRDGAHPRGPRQEAGAQAGGRDARPRRHPRARQAGRHVPARVLGRHAPAGDDRHGHHAASPTCSSPTSPPPPSTSPCRPRCSRCSSAIKDEIDSADHPHHPRPRGGGGAGRPGAWSCTPGGPSRWARPTRSSTRPGTPTRSACWPACPAWTIVGDEPLVPIVGSPPSLIRKPTGCFVPPPMPLRPGAGQLRHGRPGAAPRGRRRPHGGVPLRRGAGAR